MNKLKVFFESACLVLAVGAVGATKTGSTVYPEYYLNDAGQCVLAPLPECRGGLNLCTKSIPGQTGQKQIFDIRVNATNCGGPLTRP